MDSDGTTLKQQNSVTSSSQILLTFAIGFIISAIRVNSCALNAASFSTYHIGIEGHTIWSVKTYNVENCLQACIRLKRCKSINFDVTSTYCELNDATLVEYPNHQVTRPGHIYSSYHQFPPQVDPSCYDRPCTVTEVCVPGPVLNVPTSNCPGYACMPLNVKCPKPTIGTYTSRAIGSSLTYDCPHGYKAGDSAVCLADTWDWSKELDTTCTEIYNSACSQQSDCTDIGAECTQNKCLCLSGQLYDPVNLQCITGMRLADGDTPNVGRLEIYRDGEWATVCIDHVDPVDVRVICRMAGFLNSGSYHKPAGYTEGTGAEYKLKDLECLGTESSLFDCYINEYDDNGCNHDKDVWITCFTQPMTNDNLRIVDMNGNYDPSVMRGRPEIFFNGEWGTICKKDWNNDDVDAFCATLNPLWERKETCSSCLNIGSGRIWTSGLKCHSDDNFFECESYGWGVLHPDCPSDHSDDAGLECQLR